MAKKGIAVILLLAILLAVFPLQACATHRDVGSGGYSGTDSLLSTDLWNTYYVNAATGKKIVYSVSVVGEGTFQLLFIKGKTVTIYSDYYVLYSAEDNVTHYSNSFYVGSSDGNDFNILIATMGKTDITYSITINIQDATTDTILGGMLCLIIFFPGLIIALILGIIFYVRRKKRAAQAQQLPGVYPQPVIYPAVYQSGPYTLPYQPTYTQATPSQTIQYPSTPPQTVQPTVAQDPVTQIQTPACAQPVHSPCPYCGSGMAFIADHQKWYCPVCHRYA